jgi:RNA polymerase primary sigma factor
VQRGVQNRSRTIRVPVHVAEIERRAARTESELAVKLGRIPSQEEVAAAAKIPVDKILQAREAVRMLTSLDRPLGEDGSGTLGELIAGPDGDPATELTLNLEHEALALALASLAEEQRRVLELRFGLGGGDPASLQTVGQELGITGDRVRKIEREALEQLARSRELAELREAA